MGSTSSIRGSSAPKGFPLAYFKISRGSWYPDSRRLGKEIIELVVACASPAETIIIRPFIGRSSCCPLQEE